MSDVIIAIVPSPGHEGLVAEGPEGEMPAAVQHGTCLVCGAVRWIRWLNDPGCACGANLTEIDASRAALILHAPGGPRLGMVRAMEAADVADRREIVLTAVLSDIDTDVGDVDTQAALLLAHLLLQRGLASEVLVLPVSP